MKKIHLIQNKVELYYSTEDIFTVNSKSKSEHIQERFFI